MINVDEVFEEARVAFDASRFSDVITQLTDTILQESFHPQLYFFRGMAYYYTNDDEKAIDDLSMAIALKPDYFRSILNRGRAWARARQYNNAINDFTLAIKIRPDHAPAYRYLGTALSDKRDYAKALIQFNTALELDPGSPDIYLHRATALLEMEEYDQAIEDFDKALALKPDFASAYTSRGHAFYKMKRYDEALENFNTGIRLNPKSGRAHFGLARIYDDTGQFELTAANYKRAFCLDYDGSKLIDIFRDKFPSPYIVKALVEKKSRTEPDFATIQWLLSTCRQWDSYLQHIKDSGAPQSEPEVYYRLEAMVNYYMGNSIASYRIFDTKFDSDEYPYPLTMQDQYYLVLSALDFNEPDNGLAYALQSAAKSSDSDNSGRSSGDNYYAGQLFLLDNDLDSALQCFDRCARFIPALYGKLSVYTQQGESDLARSAARDIATAEADINNGYLEGIQPLTIDADLSLEEGAGLIQQRIHYYELQTAIATARELLARRPLHQHLPFHAALIFNP